MDLGSDLGDAQVNDASLFSAGKQSVTQDTWHNWQEIVQGSRCNIHAVTNHVAWIAWNERLEMGSTIMHWLSEQSLCGKWRFWLAKRRKMRANVRWNARWLNGRKTGNGGKENNPDFLLWKKSKEINFGVHIKSITCGRVVLLHTRNKHPWRLFKSVWLNRWSWLGDIVLMDIYGTGCFAFALLGRGGRHGCRKCRTVPLAVHHKNVLWMMTSAMLENAQMAGLIAVYELFAIQSSQRSVAPKTQSRCTKDEDSASRCDKRFVNRSELNDLLSTGVKRDREQLFWNRA